MPSRPAVAGSSSRAADQLPLKTLMLNWLKAWRDEAKARASHSAKTYHQAYTALLNCPLDFQHPAQLRQLEGVGKTLEQNLTEKLRQFCSENDVPMPKKPAQAQAKEVAATSDSDSDSSDSDSDAGGRQASKSKGKGKSTSDKASSSSKRRVTKSKGTSKASTSAPKPIKAKRAYVPQTRSGAYGLLVALYAAALEEPEEGTAGEEATESWITKARLIQLATPYADVSYVPRPVAPGAPGFGGANFNSAWSSMKTLITRGYVYRTGNPARFGLSREGFEAAAECAEKEGVEMGSAADEEEEEEEDEPAPAAAAAKGKSTSKKSAKGRSASPNKATASSSSTTTSASSAFRFTYLTDARPPLRVLERSRAALRLSDRDYTPTYRVEFPAALREHVFVRMCIEEMEGDEKGATLQGWAREMGANEKAPGLGDVEAESAPKSAAVQLVRKTSASASSTSKTTAQASSSKAAAQASSSKATAQAGPSKGAARPKPPAAVARRKEPSSSPPPEAAPVPVAAAAPTEAAPRTSGLQIPFGMRPRARVPSRTERSITPPSSHFSTTRTNPTTTAATAAHVVLSDSDSDSSSAELDRTFSQRNVRRRISPPSPRPPPPPPRLDSAPPSSPGFVEEEYVPSQARSFIGDGGGGGARMSQRDRDAERERAYDSSCESLTSSPVQISQAFVVSSQQQQQLQRRTTSGNSGVGAKEKARAVAALDSESDDDLPPLSALLNGKGSVKSTAGSVAKQPLRKKARSSAEVIDLS